MMTDREFCDNLWIQEADDPEVRAWYKAMDISCQRTPRHAGMHMNLEQGKSWWGPGYNQFRDSTAFRVPL